MEKKLKSRPRPRVVGLPCYQRWIPPELDLRKKRGLPPWLRDYVRRVMRFRGFKGVAAVEVDVGKVLIVPVPIAFAMRRKRRIIYIGKNAYEVKRAVEGRYQRVSVPL